MEVFEITGYKTGISEAGVNFLQPKDSFQNIEDGYIYREVLQSRKGIGYYTPRLAGETRVMGIWTFNKPDGSSELLAADTNFLYRYNEATNVFDQLAFGGSMVGYAGFTIGSNDAYISGTGYPTKTNTERFIICGDGIGANVNGSAIFFYDGTDVKDFMNIVDNPEYGAPIDGVLIRARHVVYFNERLNLIAPVLGGTTRNQGVLYSGIKDAGGNGDKFNIAGSGLIQLSTHDSIRGVSILGQGLQLLLEDSTRVLDITTNAFTPYRLRSIPSVIGTDAAFSAVNWNRTVDSIGKYGVIESDGRNSLRIDDKIPNFTAEKISQEYFNLTYGGFDRANGHFLWTYKKDQRFPTLFATKTQDHVLVRNYEEDSWSIFNIRLTCISETEAGRSLIWDEIEATTGNPSWNRWDTTEEVWNKIGAGKYVHKTLAGDDLGFIYELNSDADDYFTNITGITQASNASLTLEASAFKVGDEVVVEGVTGMTEINNFDSSDDDQTDINLYTIRTADPTTVTLNVDSSLFTAYVSGGKLSKPIKFYAETIPLNPYRAEGTRFYISHVEFLLNTNAGSMKVSVYENDSYNAFLRDILIKPSGISQGTEWVTLPVNNEADFMRFTFSQISPANILKIKSMRIYGDRGGFTNG